METHKGAAMQHLTLYGTHAVRAAWRNPARRVEALFATEQAAASLALDAGPALSRPAPPRPAPQIVPRAEVDRRAPPGAVHQGLLARVSPLPEADVSDFAALPGPACVLVLDQVTDPHNIGAIARSACAFGAAGLVLQRRRAPPLDGALAKAASGALEHLPIALPTNLARALEALRAAGYTAIGLDEAGADIRSMARPARVALVLGAEGPGLRRLVREGCDALAALPTRGPVPTLNVSNAAAAALFAMVGRGV
jgi:23S rRNA (guanosine2251-2'-O)-methyltransferase